MRLVTFTSGGDSEHRFGVWHADHVIEPAVVLADHAAHSAGETAAAHAPQVATEMVAFFESGADGLALANDAVEAAVSALERGDRLAGLHDADAVRLLAPVPRPRRIRDYLTYNAHAAGSGLEVPPAFAAMPICYKCNVETIVGPGDELLWPSYTDQLDFELELGFFVGRGGRDLTPQEAEPRIAGVTIFNDVSARDIQFFEMSLTIGPSKGKDFCTAMGPCVLTMDEVDEWSVEMSASVNGEVWASGSTKNRQFSFAEVLAWASLDEDVHPGEFLALGTVGGGCGLELDRWVQPGDVVELEASGVGVLRNTVGQRRTPPAGAGVPSYQGSPAVHVAHH
ncbi:2-keto-4-pentenoate hydratase/2-oxohepta-3-ene-1,7-dioic acid hydratase (catechol pathway) [Nocardioides terrae]|uniref:2-keto-4-pentenoate hydratase/2-oxohepta-3-ene-1,7-dioic acid hydratase (Catechol pathway) n=1 Tax=Nocardioides terrae TaxID=574651 RepID=A0A1I1F2J7_9ACTN|nr:fumarylacetoacetate hydrolase family protein [Nocardioides terrae]SFB93554.1 2-keto-4-pentenoate hydratase/2-oxohepta-3-ene-1,7-dioic acid hydratase (catechol pathway) [Nocardioides terrae]